MDMIVFPPKKCIYETIPEIENSKPDSATRCDNNNLLLNAKKTKELIFDFRKCDHCTPIIIGDCAVCRVEKYKYLGSVIDEKLSWSYHFDSDISVTFRF